MATSLELSELLTEVAQRVATLNNISIDQVKVSIREWREALGNFVGTPAAICTLVSSPDYWSALFRWISLLTWNRRAVALPPLVAIKFKEVVLERAHSNAKEIQWTQGAKRGHEDRKQPLELDEKRARSSDEANAETWTLNELRRIYGGGGQTIYWKQGEAVPRRVFIQPKHQPRGPAEIFVSETEGLKVGTVLPVWIWRGINRWEYGPLSFFFLSC